MKNLKLKRLKYKKLSIFYILTQIPFLCLAPDATTDTSTDTATIIPSTTSTGTGTSIATTTDSSIQTDKQEDEPSLEDFKKTIEECAKNKDDNSEPFTQIKEALKNDDYVDYRIITDSINNTAKVILHQDPQDPDTDLTFDLDKEQALELEQTSAFKKRQKTMSEDKEEGTTYYGPGPGPEKKDKKSPPKKQKRKSIPADLRPDTRYRDNYGNSYNPYYGRPSYYNPSGSMGTRPLQKKVGFATQPIAKQTKAASIKEIKAQQAKNAIRVSGPSLTTTPEPEVVSKKITVPEKKRLQHRRRTERTTSLKRIKKLESKKTEQVPEPETSPQTSWWQEFKNFWKRLW